MFFLPSFAADHLTPTGVVTGVAVGSGTTVFSPRFYQRQGHGERGREGERERDGRKHAGEKISTK